ncbi:MAG: hypothetical protein ACFCD0_16910 [Gemmataceae bacterium]
MTTYAYRKVGLQFLPALLLICCSACGGETLIPVKGKVMNGDSPLTTGTVTFHPEKSKGNETAYNPQASIGADGTYTLSSKGGSGAPPGWYKVTVVAEKPKKKGADPYALPEYLVADQYTNVGSTSLLMEVKSGAPEGSYDLKLTPRK